MYTPEEETIIIFFEKEKYNIMSGGFLFQKLFLLVGEEVVSIKLPLTGD